MKIKIIIALLLITLLAVTATLVIGQETASEKEEKENQAQTVTSDDANNPQDIFMQYLFSKLSPEEKEKIEYYQNKNPTDAFLEIIEKLRPGT